MDTNASKQVAVMEQLSQAAAAWLAGLSPRSLRDTADLQRAEDGTYDARDVLAWTARRLPRPALTDEEYERLLTIRDMISVDNQAEEAVLEALDSLRDKYGENSLLILLDLVAGNWRECVEWEQKRDTIERRRETAECDRRREEERAACGRLDIAVVCEHCGRLRRGRKWAKAKPPESHAVHYSICPSCESNKASA